MRTTAFTVSLLVAASIGAQTAVIPNGLAAAEGSSSTAYPWGRGISQIRVQYVYDSANLTNQGINYPIVINQLRWRANGGLTTAGGTYNAVAVQLATCPLNYATASTTFANNLGGDVTTVYNGPVTVAAGGGTTPNNWYVTIPLTTPFLYDPTAGDLTFDFATNAAGWVGTAGPAIDCGTSTSATSRIYNLSNFAATTGTFQNNVGITCELGYTVPPGTATNQAYGTGCGAAAASFYQEFANMAAAQAALQNTAITMTNTGAGYVVTNGGTFVPPSGTATALALTDDSQTAVTLSAPMPIPGGTTASLMVCSNGFVSVATGNGTAFAGSATLMLAMPQTVWASWHDFNPAIVGSGVVKFEEVAGVAYITWDGVWDFAGTSAADASTLQFQFDVATGNVCIAWGTISPNNASATTLTAGFSPGGPSLNLGPTNFATGLPLVLPATDVPALGLTASARPITGTTVVYTATNVNPSAVITAHLISLGGVDPGIDLTGLGAPGCWQYVDLSLASTFLVFGPSYQNSFSVPNDPSFTGLPLDNQAASLVPGINALGVVTSPAICSTIGTL